MAAWWIYGEDGAGHRWFDYVPNTKFYAYARIRTLTNTRSSFNGGEKIAPGAYEFSTHETRSRGERWFVFTQGGALHLVEDAQALEGLGGSWPPAASSPLKARFRAV